MARKFHEAPIICLSPLFLISYDLLASPLVTAVRRGSSDSKLVSSSSTLTPETKTTMEDKGRGAGESRGGVNLTKKREFTIFVDYRDR